MANLKQHPAGTLIKSGFMRGLLCAVAVAGFTILWANLLQMVAPTQQPYLFLLVLLASLLGSQIQERLMRIAHGDL